MAFWGDQTGFCGKTILFGAAHVNLEQFLCAKWGVVHKAKRRRECCLRACSADVARGEAEAEGLEALRQVRRDRPGARLAQVAVHKPEVQGSERSLGQPLRKRLRAAVADVAVSKVEAQGLEAGRHLGCYFSTFLTKGKGVIFKLAKANKNHFSESNPNPNHFD